MIASGEGASRPRDASHDPSRAGHDCWLCGHPIHDPPEIIGRWSTTNARVAHRRCLQTLGELDLQLPPDPGEPTR